MINPYYTEYEKKVIQLRDNDSILCMTCHKPITNKNFYYKQNNNLDFAVHTDCIDIRSIFPKDDILGIGECLLCKQSSQQYYEDCVNLFFLCDKCLILSTEDFTTSMKMILDYQEAIPVTEKISIGDYYQYSIIDIRIPETIEIPNGIELESVIDLPKILYTPYTNLCDYYLIKSNDKKAVNCNKNSVDYGNIIDILVTEDGLITIC